MGLGATGHTKLPLRFKDLFSPLKTSLGFSCTQRLMVPLYFPSPGLARAPCRVAKVTPATAPCPGCQINQVLPCPAHVDGKKGETSISWLSFLCSRLPIFAGG